VWQVAENAIGRGSISNTQINRRHNHTITPNKTIIIKISKEKPAPFGSGLVEKTKGPEIPTQFSMFRYLPQTSARCQEVFSIFGVFFLCD
jgi:hypothetical protein